jgi:hypothetical protein
MSGAYPTTIGFSSMKFSSLQPTLVSVSHALTRQSRSRGGAQRWGIEATYPPNLSRAELAPIIAFALKQRGQWDTFTLTPPALWATARGIATGTPKIKGGSQSGRNIATDGWTASQTGILLAGDFLKFAGHDKVYMVTENANSDGSGDATLVIEPALMATPADNEDITVTGVPFTVAFASDSHEFDINSASHHSFSVKFVEVV